MTPRLNVLLRLLIWELHSQNASLTFNAIGGIVGVSRERVRQIALQQGWRSPVSHARTVEEYWADPRRKCPECGGPKEKRNKTCGCVGRMVMVVDLVCQECGKAFEREWAQQRNLIRHNPSHGAHVFCSRRCFGLWAGKTHGFIAHPENAHRNVAS